MLTRKWRLDELRASSGVVAIGALGAVSPLPPLPPLPPPPSVHIALCAAASRALISVLPRT